MAIILKLPGGDRLSAPVGDGGEFEHRDGLFAFPLSPAQERVWQADRHTPGNPAYNCAFRWSLRGPLNISVLERAFNEIVRRHEILRARFTQIDLQPVQLIAPSAHLGIAVTDLRSLSEEERDAQMNRICAEEAQRSFDVGTDALIRIRLVQVEELHHIMSLTLHLLVADGWSVRVIMEELRKLYDAFSEGHGSPLPGLTIQYPDYVVWQQEGRVSSEVGNQLAYWKSKLDGYERLEVPGDLPPPSEFTVNSRILSFQLSRELTDALSDFGNRQGGTMFVTTLAACKALLCRYTGKTDVCVGSELAGRNRTELEELVGLFTNRVVFRTDVSGDPQFTELAKRVRETTWEVLANQDVAFEDVIKVRNEDGDPCPDPFCHVNFNCYRAYGGSSNFEFAHSGVRVIPIPSPSPGAMYSLYFFMVERETGWRLSLEYNTDLYSEGFCQRLLENFRSLLEGIATNPHRKISEIPISASLACEKDEASSYVAPAETAYDARGDDASEGLCALPASVVQERFWLLAKVDPQGSAFNMRATVRLTGSLSMAGLEESFQRMIDRHEVLRTTFADRDGNLVQIISDVGKFALTSTNIDITQKEAEARLQELLSEEARRPFDLERGPLFRARIFRLQSNEHVLIITIHHIIADGWSQSIIQRELWTMYEALTSSQQPSLAPLPIQYADFASWQKEWLASQEAAEHLKFWSKQLAAPLPVLDFPTDRPIQNRSISFSAIETAHLREGLVRRLKELSQAEQTTVFTLMLAAFWILLFRFTGQDDVVVGSPAANRKAETEPLIGPFAAPIAFRLRFTGDPTLRDVLRQAVQVTLDALDHADLPFEVLLTHLKTRAVNGRSPLFQFYFLYQTAFLQPRQLPQLSITPMRSVGVGTPFELQLTVIERSEEVYANLEYNPDLFDSSTIQDVLGYYDCVLQAFVADPDQLVSQLDAPTGQKPKTAPHAQADIAREYVPPRNALELEMAEMWKRVFELPRIGVHDDFFDLGGQSLLAARLISEVEKQFGARIDLSTLLVDRTIEQLTRRIGAAGRKRSNLVPIRPWGSKPPLFCVHGGGGHVLSYRDIADGLPFDQPVFGLSAPELDGAQQSMTVEELAAAYIKDIHSIQPTGPYQLCGYSFGGLVAYEMAAQLADTGNQVGVLAIFDTINQTHYRNLSTPERLQFWSAYLIDRCKRYYRRIRRGRFDIAVFSALYFVYKNLRLRIWKAASVIFGLTKRPMPKPLRDNLTMFRVTAWSYNPRPYSGRVILFRAEGLDPKYRHNISLGWEQVARGGVVVHFVPGDHLSFMRNPNVSKLVEHLNNYLSPTHLTR